MREYSKGMRQRLGFAQALLGTPRLLFLDEPTTGLDPGAIRDFYRILRELRDEGVTMVLTSHILAEIQERVDRLAIMEDGRIRATGTVQDLREGMNLPLWFDMLVEPAVSKPPARTSSAVCRWAPSETHEETGAIAVRCSRRCQDGRHHPPGHPRYHARPHGARAFAEDVFFGISDRDQVSITLEFSQIAIIAGKEFLDRIRNRWVLAVGMVDHLVFALVDRLLRLGPAGRGGFARST